MRRSKRQRLLREKRRREEAQMFGSILRKELFSGISDLVAEMPDDEYIKEIKDQGLIPEDIAKKVDTILKAAIQRHMKRNIDNIKKKGE